MINSNPFNRPAQGNGHEGRYQTAGRRAELRENALLDCLLSRFPQPPSLLEVGRGTGHFTRWFSPLGFDTVGLDPFVLKLREAMKYNDAADVLGNAQDHPLQCASQSSASIIIHIASGNEKDSTTGPSTPTAGYLKI